MNLCKEAFDSQTLEELFCKIQAYTSNWTEQDECLRLIESHKMENDTSKTSTSNVSTKKPRGEVWCLSDTHAFHFNIIRYCNRPFKDEYEMNFELERRWNILVQPEDIVIHVGDLTAGLKGRKEELKTHIQNLVGRKILVKGNHDHQDDSFYLDAGFEKVVDYIAVNNLLFAHVPDTLEKESDHPHPWAAITKKLREAFSPKLVIHGHIHRADTPEFEGHFNCAADRHNFMPFTIQSALDKVGLGDLAKAAREDIYAWLEKKEAENDDTQDTPPL